MPSVQIWNTNLLRSILRSDFWEILEFEADFLGCTDFFEIQAHGGDQTLLVYGQPLPERFCSDEPRIDGSRRPVQSITIANSDGSGLDVKSWNPHDQRAFLILGTRLSCLGYKVLPEMFNTGDLEYLLQSVARLGWR